MALPKLKDVEVALLKSLVTLGGKAPTANVYPEVTKQFPELTQEQLSEALPSGGNRWTNRIQWVRLRLIEKSEMASPAHGVWSITDKGRERVSQIPGPAAKAAAPEPDVSLVELYEEYEQTFRSKLLERLLQMTPAEFEQFAPKLLRAFGFGELIVTGKTGDGGVDGHGKLRVGLALMSVAFQCKRWQGNVPRTEVDKFRGAIQGEYEQGIFFTTSDFTAGAREASIKKGAVPIVLLNGGSILNIMIDKELGVSKRPLLFFEERSSELVGE